LNFFWSSMLVYQNSAFLLEHAWTHAISCDCETGVIWSPCFLLKTGCKKPLVFCPVLRLFIRRGDQMIRRAKPGMSSSCS
jgi:hypothetical protein